ncbi:MAG: glycosyltransferase family 2 protein [Candidatus Aminicenantes bacterium]|nr:glycosyltransferase family 2 protein [Candidatus Aminicenantes bacterium]
MSRIGIIITSYNNRFYLKNCVESIFDKISNNNFNIVIVDNASEEYGVKKILSLLKKERTIQIIENERNIGYSKALNSGLSLIKSDFKDIKYILILNQDTKLLNNILDKSIKVMKERENVGICGPRLFNPDGTIQTSFFNFPSGYQKLAESIGLDKLSVFFRKVRILRSLSTFLPSFVRTHLKNFANLRNPIEVSWIRGASLIVRKEVFVDILGFDENFEMYAEDMDFCQRARAKGWKIYYIPDAHVLHYGGIKPPKRSKRLANIYYDSLAFYYKKHFKGIKRNLLEFLNHIERIIKVKLFKHS